MRIDEGLALFDLCRECDGGRLGDSEAPCPVCDGKGYRLTENGLEVVDLLRVLGLLPKETGPRQEAPS